VVDASGKVLDPRVTESTHADFEKPALNAIKQWKFEPAVRGGQRVACRMRVPIRFQPSSQA
jgi:protein TonB